jgi:hypothetical protein
MASKLVWAALALSLVTMTGLPAAFANHQEPTTDRVVLDADTGDRLTPPARPGTNVTVAVDGVEASTGGFTLAGPTGEVFVNQTSRSDGVVEFWQVPAAPGPYEVRQKTGNTTTTVVEGVPIAASIATGSECMQTHWGSYDCEEGDCESSGWRKIEEAIRWTPILLVNSPPNGEAVASTTWGDTRSVYIAAGGMKSRTETGEKIEAEDGHSRGMFRLAKWGIYEKEGSACTAGYSNGRSAKVIDWEPYGYMKEQVFELTGDSRFTDRDNEIKVEEDGEESIRFNARYYQKDRERQGESTHVQTEREIIGFWGEISAGAYGINFDVIRFEVTDEDEQSSYRYEFDGGRVFIDELNNGHGWAFCRPGYEDC